MAAREDPCRSRSRSQSQSQSRSQSRTGAAKRQTPRRQDSKRSDDFRFSNLTTRQRPQASATWESLRRALGLPEIGQKAARSGSLPCIPRPSPPIPARQMNPARFGKISGALISSLSKSGLPDGNFARPAKPNAEREPPLMFKPDCWDPQPLCFWRIARRVAPKVSTGFCAQRASAAAQARRETASKRRAPGACAHA